MDDGKTDAPTGICPVCGRDIRLRKDGTIRQHGTKTGWPPSNCRGWGSHPMKEPSRV